MHLQYCLSPLSEKGISFTHIPVSAGESFVTRIPRALNNSNELPSVPCLGAAAPPQAITAKSKLLSLFITNLPCDFLMLLTGESVNTFTPALSAADKSTHTTEAAVCEIGYTLPSCSLIKSKPISRKIASVFFGVYFSTAGRTNSHASK